MHLLNIILAKVFFISGDSAFAKQLPCPLKDGKLTFVDWEKFPIGTSLDGVIISSTSTDTVRCVAGGRVAMIGGGTHGRVTEIDAAEGSFLYFEMEKSFLRTGFYASPGTPVGIARRRKDHFEFRFDVVTKQKPVGGDAPRFVKCKS